MVQTELDLPCCTLSLHSKRVLSSNPLGAKVPRWMDTTIQQYVLHSLQLWLLSVSGRVFLVQMVLSEIGSGGISSIRSPWIYKAWVFILEVYPWIYSVYRKRERK